jgi:small subunit ribosomal protein S1
MSRKDKDPLSSEIDAALEGVNLQEIGDDVAQPAKAGARSGSAGSKLKRGTIVGISGKDVFVELGPRVQGVISIDQFEKTPAVGEAYEFSLHGREDDLWVLSRREAQAVAAWDDIQPGSLVKARVTGQNTGGLELKVGPLPAFMPASQVGLSHEANLSTYMLQTLVCQVLEVDAGRKRILLSRRAVLEKERDEERREAMGKFATGQVLRGKVTRVEPFGAFVSLGGGVEGLIHVSNLSRRRIENAKEFLQPGQEVEFQILEIKDGGKRIGLGMKQLEADPWQTAASRFPADTVLNGKVTRLTEFGAFVEVAPGLEGLIHLSQLGKERVRRASDVLKAGQDVSVRVVSVEPGRERMSLSRMDARGAVLGSEEAVDASVIDEAIQKSSGQPTGTNLGNLFRRAMKPPDAPKSS